MSPPGGRLTQRGLTRRELLAGGLGAALVLAAPSGARAARPKLAQVRCPVDGTRFRALRVPRPELFADAQATAPPRRARDLAPLEAAQLEPPRQALWRCPRCHYAAWSDDFERPVDEVLQRRVLAELRPRFQLPGKEQPAWVGFDLAQTVYGWRGAPYRPRVLALCQTIYELGAGAPCGTLDRGMIVRKLRWTTRETLRLAIVKKEIAAKELCLARYLLAEMTRRAGQFSDSLDDFRRVASTRPCPAWLSRWGYEQGAKAKVGLAGE